MEITLLMLSVLFLGIAGTFMYISFKQWDTIDNLREEVTILKESRKALDDVKRLVQQELLETKEELESVKSTVDTTKSSQKSTEVRTGLLLETWAPFLDTFPYDPRSARFLGNPLDYVVFGEDEVVFLEVKTGDSSLSKSQRNIKELIEAGKVRFELMRIR